MLAAFDKWCASFSIKTPIQRCSLMPSKGWLTHRQQRLTACSCHWPDTFRVKPRVG
jgi:hypothetical protein